MLHAQAAQIGALLGAAGAGEDLQTGAAGDLHGRVAELGAGVDEDALTRLYPGEVVQRIPGRHVGAGIRGGLGHGQADRLANDVDRSHVHVRLEGVAWRHDHLVSNGQFGDDVRADLGDPAGALEAERDRLAFRLRHLARVFIRSRG